MATQLHPETIVAAAEREAGSSDWGGDGFRQGLSVLTQSILNDSGLAPDKLAAAEQRLVGILVNRLRIVEDRKRNPAIADEKIEKPLIILGLPRSGTTLLQALLTEDPDARSTLHWELSIPSPPPEKATYRTDPRIAIVQAQVDAMAKATPEIMKRHPFAATLPEECGRLFELEMTSQNFFASYYIPSYRDWLLNQDFRQPYETHRRVLQHYQWRCKFDHWVLKSPKHLFSLDALIETYPDARLVWLHRDPAQNMVSLASFITPLRQANIPDADPKKIGQEWTAMQELALYRGMASRDRMRTPDAICDVYYKDLMADPLGTVAKIYRHFDMTFTDGARAAIANWLKENPQDKFGRHRYAAADFGLDPDTVRAHFAHYIRRFDVPIERGTV